MVEKLHANGLRNIALDPEYGGAGADPVTLAMLAEELAVGDLGVSVVMAQTWKIGQTIQGGGTPEQRERFLPALRDNPRGVLSIGFTEPDMGSDYIIPHTDPQAGPRLTASAMGTAGSSTGRSYSSATAADPLST